jgi:Tol biopolymer transport system component
VKNNKEPRMKNYSSDISINRTSSIILWLVVCLLLIGLFGCEGAAVDNKQTEEYKRNHPSTKEVNMGLPNFVPGNNDVIIIDYATVFWSKIATFNLKDGKFKRFENIQIKHVNFPTYSPDCKKIAFLGAHDEYGSNRNIYIMHADGSNIRQITDFDFTRKKEGSLETSNFVIAPTFSPDGNRIIYAKARFKRERAYPLRGSMNTAWDVYEVDVATGTERRRTNYDFYEMSSPYYMPDGKRFIFSAEGPVNSTGKGPKSFKEYEEMYQKNFIFIMDGINNELKPAFTYGSNSARPSVMPDNSIIFVSEAGARDSPKATQDVFIYKKKQVKRLTQLDSWISHAAISSDGNKIMFSKRSGQNIYDYSTWIMNSDGTGIEEIKIPLNLLKQ